MTVEVRFPGGRWRWLALASPLLGFVALSCRIGYDLVPQGALSHGGAAGSSAAAPAGGFAGDFAEGASAGTASGASGGSAGEASAGSASGGVVGDAGAGSGGDGGLTGGAGAGGGSGARAGAGGGSGAGAGGGSGAGGRSGSCGEPANCACQSFGGHAYWFCSTPTARDAAQTLCAGGGLDLVRIDDSLENAWILGIALAQGMISPTTAPSDLLFTGANDSVTLDDWQWQDGTLFWSGGSPVNGRYSNWAGSNPQSSSARRCAGMFYTGEWQSRSCTALQPFVCEGP